MVLLESFKISLIMGYTMRGSFYDMINCLFRGYSVQVVNGERGFDLHRLIRMSGSCWKVLMMISYSVFAYPD